MRKFKLIGSLVAVAAISVLVGGSVSAEGHDVKPAFNYYDLEKLQENPAVLGGFRPYFVDDQDNLVRGEDSFLRFVQPNEADKWLDFVDADEIDFCSDGDHNLWFYVHNGASELTNTAEGTWARDEGDNFWNADNANLNGPSVAHNTTVRLSVPTEAASSHMITASIDSDQTEAIAYSLEVSCADETKQISLVYSEATLHTPLSPPAHGSIGEFRLEGDIASTDGAALGYSGGIVPSCWDFVSIVRGKLQVIVSEKTMVEEDPEEDPEKPEMPPEEEPEDEPEEEPEDEPGTEPPEEKPEDEPEEIHPLGAGSAPLAAVFLSSAVGAVGYRIIQSRRRH